MHNERTSGLVEGVAQMERDAGEVADAVRNITRPSDVADVIRALMRTQQVMSRVYSGLAAWHQAVEVGVHHSGEIGAQNPENPGWVRAEIALDEAAQYSSDAVRALERAHDANVSARWFDEIRTDES